MPDALFFKLLPNFLGNAFDGTFHGFFGVHLQNQVHTALQVKTEIDLFVRPQGRPQARKDIDDRRYNDSKN